MQLGKPSKSIVSSLCNIYDFVLKSWRSLEQYVWSLVDIKKLWMRLCTIKSMPRKELDFRFVLVCVCVYIYKFSPRGFSEPVYTYIQGQTVEGLKKSARAAHILRRNLVVILHFSSGVIRR